MALTWWMWLLAGCILLFLELLTPGGFYIFFFGIGAIVVSALAALNLVSYPAAQWLLFAAVSVIMLLLLRTPLQRRIGTAKKDIDTMVGEIAKAMEEIGVAGMGKAELRGTVWTVHNSGERLILPGEPCRVERVEGLTLYVRRT